MPKLKTGIALSCLRQPLKQALHTVARLGAEGVQIDVRTQLRPEELSQTGARHIRKILSDQNLAVSSLAFPTRHGFATLENLDRRVEAARQAMTFARQLGAAVVVSQIGRVPEDDQSVAWRTLVEVLGDLGRHGERVGAFLAAKTGSESGAELARLIAALPEGSLAVDLDPGLLIVGGHSPREAVEALGRDVLHVTASDAVRDLAVGRGMDVQLGRGSADFPELLGALEEFDYRGWVTIDRRGAENPVAEVGESVQYLRSM